MKKNNNMKMISGKDAVDISCFPLPFFRLNLDMTLFPVLFKRSSPFPAAPHIDGFRFRDPLGMHLSYCPYHGAMVGILVRF